MDNSKALGTEPVRKLLIQYSLPAVIGMLVQVLYSIVDTIFVGHFVGEDGFAAVTLVFPMICFLNGFGMLVGVGACSFTALLLGQRRLDDAEKTLGNSFSMILISTAVMMVCLFTIGTLFVQFTDTSEVIRRMGRQFLYIAIGTGIFPAMMFGLNNLIRVQGNPRYAMGFLFLGFILNAIFNPIFIGIFRWGVAGSAWATALSQFITMCAIFVFFRSKRSLLKLRRRHFRLDWSICKPVLLIGLAPFTAQTVACFQGMLLINQLTAYGGDPAMTIWGVIHRAAMIIFMVVLGFYQGAQPIIGYNYSARQFDRVREVSRLAIWAASVWCVATFIPIMLFPEGLVRVMILRQDISQDVLAIAPVAIRMTLAMIFVMGFQVVSSNYFQAVGKPKLSLFLTLTRQVIFLIPALLLIPHIAQWLGYEGILGVWGAFIFADTLAFSLSFWFFRREMRQLKSGDVHIRILDPPPPVVEGFQNPV